MQESDCLHERASNFDQATALFQLRQVRPTPSTVIGPEAPAAIVHLDTGRQFASLELPSFVGTYF